MDQVGFVLTVALLRALSLLRYGLVARIGSAIGATLYVLPSRRKNIVLANLRLFFPEKRDREYDDLARGHFRHVVRSYLERGIQWFGSAQSLNKHVEVDSKIDFHDKDAPPTIFMGFHYVSIEVGCILYSTRSPAASLYTRMSNARLCDLTRCHGSA